LIVCCFFTFKEALCGCSYFSVFQIWQILFFITIMKSKSFQMHFYEE
jgi:hypothetical protein